MAEKPKTNINQCSLEQLIAVPGIGPALAKRVIDNRPYSQLSELVRVQGISNNTLERLLPNLTIDAIEEDLLMDVHIATASDDAINEPFETVETEVFAPEEMTPEELVSETNFDQSNYDENLISDSEEKQIDEILFENESEATTESLESNNSSLENDQEKMFDKLNDEVKVETSAKSSGPPSDSDDTKSTTDQSEHNKIVTRSQLWWSVAGTAIITVILTILITLGILAVVNGGLQYASIEKAYSLENSIITMGDRTDAIQGQIDGIHDRLDMLETVEARVTKLENSTQELQTKVAETLKTLDTLSVTIEEIQQQIDLLQIAAQKSQDLRNGLLDLLINIEGLPVPEEGK